MHTKKPLLLALVVTGLILTLLAVRDWSRQTAVAAANPTLQQDSNPESETLETAVSDLPANCRYGIATVKNPWGFEWFPQFGFGWFVNFNVSPNGAPANHAEFMHTVRLNREVNDVWYPVWPPLTDAGLGAYLDANPGATWLVGNEMEVDWWSGDRLYPNEFASYYHDVYQYIKQRDPSAQVGIGGMSMATPGRIQYLDIAWDTYLNEYGVPMPVDIWNVHLYILSEWKHFGDNQGDGRVALGTDPAIAKRAPNGPAATECPKEDVYCRAEHDSMTIFNQQVVGLRTWMKAHGQQNKPLIVSEFSQLYQPSTTDEFGNKFPASRVNAFMEAAFDYLETTKDPNLGYPQDENRLVQQWLWYPLVTDPGWSGYSSNLLKDNYASYTPGDLGALNTVGQKMRSEVLARATTVNLKAGTAASVAASGGSATLKVGFRNNGNTYIGQPFQVTFYADSALTQVIGATTVNPVINGCHWHHDTHSATAAWSGLSSGVYPYWAKIDSGNQIGESNEGDNVVSGLVFVNTAATPPPTPTQPPGDFEPPVVNWLQPVGNETAYAVTGAETVQLAAEASDNMGVERVRFYRWDVVNAQWVDIAEVFTPPYTANLNTAVLPDGWNQINARAYDISGKASEPRHIWLVKNETPPAATATPTAVPTETNTPFPTPTASPTLTQTPQPGSKPALSLPDQLPAYSGHVVDMPVAFTGNGFSVTSGLFSLEFDPACLLLNSNDSNEDGIPDGVRENLPASYAISVAYQTAGRLDFVFADTGGSPSQLSDGDLFELAFVPACDPGSGSTTETAVQFVTNPPAAFGTLNNGSITGETNDGSVLILPLHKIFMPDVMKP